MFDNGERQGIEVERVRETVSSPTGVRPEEIVEPWDVQLLAEKIGGAGAITATQILLTSPFCYLKSTFTNGSNSSTTPCLSPTPLRPLTSHYKKRITQYEEYPLHVPKH